MRSLTPILLISLCISFAGAAQTDSAEKKRKAALAIDFGSLPYFPGENLSAGDYRSFVNDDPDLEKDFGLYTRSFSVYSTGRPYGIFFSARYIIDMSHSHKGGRELSFGLRQGRVMLASTAYYWDTTTVFDIYQGMSSGNELVHFKEKSSQYQFDIAAEALFVPVRFEVTTNRKKWIRATAGVEFAPGLLFSPEYVKYHSEWVNNVIVPNGTPETEFYRYRTFGSDEGFSSWKKKRLPGVGFGGYLAIPIGFSLGGPEHIPVVGRIRVFATLNPGFVYYWYRYAGGSAKFSSGASIGIRYALR